MRIDSEMTINVLNGALVCINDSVSVDRTSNNSMFTSLCRFEFGQIRRQLEIELEVDRDPLITISFELNFKLMPVRPVVKQQAKALSFSACDCFEKKLV